MFDTMYASEGVGLAAPQIGKSLRLFVVDTSPFGQYDPSAAGYKRVFVNPEITEESDEEVLMNEGCLSLPGLHEDVYRPEKIRIRYFDERFQEHEEVLEGWPAGRCSTNTTTSRALFSPTAWLRCARRS